MRIIGLLAWWNEPEERLHDCVTSVAPLTDHLIALDGVYATFPHPDPLSPLGQVDAIEDAARVAGIGCDVVVPPSAWAGNEIEKRSHLFNLGNQVADPYEDWFLIIDADTRLRESHGVFESLRANQHDTALSMLTQHRTQQVKWRNLCRAIPGLTVTNHHAGYVTGDGRVLWNGHYGPQEPGLEVYCVIDHVRSADTQRLAPKQAYEATRGEQDLHVASRNTYVAVNSDHHRLFPAPNHGVTECV